MANSTTQLSEGFLRAALRAPAHRATPFGGTNPTLAFVCLVLILPGWCRAEPADVIQPNENLIVEGIGPVPASLAERVGRYTEFRGAVPLSWHPTRREMLISTRFADTPQIHLVKMPGGARTQLTFFKEPARGGLLRPKVGDCFVFSKDVGG